MKWMQTNIANFCPNRCKGDYVIHHQLLGGGVSVCQCPSCATQVRQVCGGRVWQQHSLEKIAPKQKLLLQILITKSPLRKQVGLCQQKAWSLHSFPISCNQLVSYEVFQNNKIQQKKTKITTIITILWSYNPTIKQKAMGFIKGKTFFYNRKKGAEFISF